MRRPHVEPVEPVLTASTATPVVVAAASVEVAVELTTAESVAAVEVATAVELTAAESVAAVEVATAVELTAAESVATVVVAAAELVEDTVAATEEETTAEVVVVLFATLVTMIEVSFSFWCLRVGRRITNLRRNHRRDPRRQHSCSARCKRLHSGHPNMSSQRAFLK